MSKNEDLDTTQKETPRELSDESLDAASGGGSNGINALLQVVQQKTSSASLDLGSAATNQRWLIAAKKKGD